MLICDKIEEILIQSLQIRSLVSLFYTANLSNQKSQLHSERILPPVACSIRVLGTSKAIQSDGWVGKRPIALHLYNAIPIRIKFDSIKTIFCKM